MSEFERVMADAAERPGPVDAGGVVLGALDDLFVGRIADPLIEAGYRTLLDLEGVRDETLLEIDGIGEAAVATIRAVEAERAGDVLAVKAALAHERSELAGVDADRDLRNTTADAFAEAFAGVAPETGVEVIRTAGADSVIRLQTESFEFDLVVTRVARRTDDA